MPQIMEITQADFLGASIQNDPWKTQEKGEFSINAMLDGCNLFKLKEDCDASTIQSTMFYLERKSLYDVEKPYSMRYQPDEAIPQSNYQRIKHPLTIHSMRSPGTRSFQLNECGFQMIELNSKLTYNEYWDNTKAQQIYIEEVKAALKRELGGKYVHVLDYAVSFF
jgi:hypothetical protein